MNVITTGAWENVMQKKIQTRQQWEIQKVSSLKIPNRHMNSRLGSPFLQTISLQNQ